MDPVLLSSFRWSFCMCVLHNKLPQTPLRSRHRTNKAVLHHSTFLVRKTVVIMSLCLLLFMFILKCNHPSIQLMYMNIYWVPTVLQHCAKLSTFPILKDELVQSVPWDRNIEKLDLVQCSNLDLSSLRKMRATGLQIGEMTICVIPVFAWNVPGVGGNIIAQGRSHKWEGKKFMSKYKIAQRGFLI